MVWRKTVLCDSYNSYNDIKDNDSNNTDINVLKLAATAVVLRACSYWHCYSMALQLLLLA